MNWCWDKSLFLEKEDEKFLMMRHELVDERTKVGVIRACSGGGWQ